jgi:hypothetical protein
MSCGGAGQRSQSTRQSTPNALFPTRWATGPLTGLVPLDCGGAGAPQPRSHAEHGNEMVEGGAASSALHWSEKRHTLTASAARPRRPSLRTCRASCYRSVLPPLTARTHGPPWVHRLDAPRSPPSTIGHSRLLRTALHALVVPLQERIASPNQQRVWRRISLLDAPIGSVAAFHAATGSRRRSTGDAADR